MTPQVTENGRVRFVEPLRQTVQVFISTFRDIHAALVFPALCEKLDKHRVRLVDIDLRCGLTQEQSDNDKALDLCLQQIEESQPFFIGILGERYGYVPQGIDQQARS